VVPGVVEAVFRPGLVHGAVGPDGKPVGYGVVWKNFLAVLVPVLVAVTTFGAAWWYVVIHNAPPEVAPKPAATIAAAQDPAPNPAPVPGDEQPEELGSAGSSVAEPAHSNPDGPPEEMTSLAEPVQASGAGHVPPHFNQWFWGLAALSALLIAVYYLRMDGEQLEILKELIVSVMPLGVLTFVVLAVILFRSPSPPRRNQLPSGRWAPSTWR